MKTIQIVIGAALILMTASCKKNDATYNNVDFAAIVGTYDGTLQNESTSQTDSAISVITQANDEAIYVHCTSSYLDTTFMLNVYENGSQTMVCYTGDDFTHEYGHVYGNHMMHDSGETAWQHHMTDEHQGGDLHYGSFNMSDHHFGYTFNMNQVSPAYTIEFNGQRQ